MKSVEKILWEKIEKKNIQKFENFLKKIKKYEIFQKFKFF